MHTARGQAWSKARAWPCAATTGVAAAVLLSLSPVPAHGQDVAEARKHAQKAATLYELGKYGEAAVEYEAAYQEIQDAALLFNIGQAYRLSGDGRKALNAYRNYLKRSPDAPNRALVQRWIDELSVQFWDDPFKPMQQPPPPPQRKAKPAQAQAQPAAVKREEETKPIYRTWPFWAGATAVLVAGTVVVVALNRDDGVKLPRTDYGSMKF